MVTARGYVSLGSKKVDYDRHNGLVSESTEQLLCREGRIGMGQSRWAVDALERFRLRKLLGQARAAFRGSVYIVL